MTALTDIRGGWRAMALAGVLAVAGLPLSAQAERPFGTLTFIEPNATVLGHETIEVWVRLTLDAASAPLQIDGGTPQWNLTPADLNPSPDQYLSIDSVQTNTYYVCSGNFTQVCDPAAYAFEFNLTGPHSFNWLTQLDLQPGASLDYLFGRFVPQGGAAPEGTYTFYDSGATLMVYGSGYRALRDASGQLVLDAQGQTQYELELDADGNPVWDTVQQPVYVPLLDGDGNPLLDGDGQPLYEQAYDPDTGEPLWDDQGNPIYLQATDPDTGELLFVTEQVARRAVVPLFNGEFTLATQGCNASNSASCAAFVRTVSAVPEAGSSALLLLGLASLGLLGLRQRQPRA